MNASKIKVGKEVVKIDGGILSYSDLPEAGRIGTVIELAGGRVRVNWTKIHDPRNPAKIKKITAHNTWERISSVHDRSIPYTFTVKKTRSKKDFNHIDLTLVFSIK